MLQRLSLLIESIMYYLLLAFLGHCCSQAVIQMITTLGRGDLMMDDSDVFSSHFLGFHDTFGTESDPTSRS